jgi:23S rRNA pseudouridine1911/1915/1917 synthase
MKLTVEQADEGTRLDSYLAQALGSRSRAQRLIEAGAVCVDGVAVAKRHRVRAGESIEVIEPAEPTAPQDIANDTDVSVAYEDEHLLVVDKPAGLVVHPAPGHEHGTLAQILAGRAAGGEEGWRAGIVHRLDRETSGLMVVAKTDATHRLLKEAIQAREVQREYTALVEGRPPSRSGTIDAPIGRDRRVRTRISTETSEPREARTHFEIERELPGATLLLVTLETGRTHQIRVHLQAIGHPVCGDPEYGTTGRYGLQRQFLHASRLSFEHPITAEAVDLVSDLPPDLAAALERAAGER